MKKVLIFALTLALLLCCVPVASVAEEAATPAGTAITTAAEFEAIKDDPAGRYYLANDIDFGGKEYTNFICTEFNGTLDGNGHAIYNFKIVGGTADTGLFQYVASGTTAANTIIKNLYVGKADAPVVVCLAGTGYACGVLAGAQNSKSYLLNISNVHIYADVDAVMTANMNFGGFLGCSQSCVVANCTMNGSINASSTAKWVNAAGFAANPKNKAGSFVNCKNYADITVCAANTIRAGGIIGYAAIETAIESCTNFGDFNYTVGTAEPAFSRFGGIIAEAAAAKVTVNGCFNFGDIHSAFHTGAIMGYNCKSDCSVKNNVNYGKLTTANEETPAGIAYGKTEVKISASNNLDMSETVKSETVDTIKVAGVQSTAVANDLYDVRFIGTADSLEYKSVGFEIKIFYGADKALESLDADMETSTVYTAILGKDAQGGNVTVNAADLGGAYIFAMTVSRIPTAAANGNVTFVITPFAKTASATVYGESAVCTYSDGAFVGIETIA